MKIKPDQYPLIIIATLVIFTVLGLALGFVPGRGGSEGHGFTPTQVVVTSVYLGNI